MLSAQAARMGTLCHIGLLKSSRGGKFVHAALALSDRCSWLLLARRHGSVVMRGGTTTNTTCVHHARSNSTAAVARDQVDEPENHHHHHTSQQHDDLGYHHYTQGHALAAASFRAHDTTTTSTIHGVTHASSMILQKEPWRRNLGRGNENAVLTGPRHDHEWFTGVAPSDMPKGPGVTRQQQVNTDGDVAAAVVPVLRSLPLPNLSAVTRANALAYFDNSWTLYETLFAGLKGEEGFYRPPPHGLRHPQIFYYGHTACLYINKLRLAGVLIKPVNPYFESIFEVGVDEMLWDDMHKNDMLWPTVSEVTQYRRQVYETVVHAIQTHPSLDHDTNDEYDNNSGGGVHVDQSHPMWALFMGFEHERIHLETSSVLFRETPLHLVQTPKNWPPLHPSAWNGEKPTCHPVPGVDYPPNRMIAVAESSIVDLGKPADFPSFGWDNEYGERKIHVPPFCASEHMVTNGEFWHFVASGGYRTAEYWCDDGWAWRTHRNLKWPFFWQPAGPAGSHEYTLRTIFEIIPMPWDWPVDVNYYEAKAYCLWKTAMEQKDDASASTTDGTTMKRPYRLLTEAEHHVIRHKDHNLEAARQNVNADKVMVTSGGEFAKGVSGCNLNLAYSSQNPVNFFPPSQTGHRDTTGNAWEWTEDHFNPLKGFEAHHIYDDFSMPCFDGKHSIIVGGSFISTGDEASVFARFHFRPHFLQHSGFRLVRSDDEAPATHLFAGAFEGQAAAAQEASERAAVSGGGSTTSTSWTPSSNVYETDESLHMYLGLHYPTSGEKEGVPPVLPHDNAPIHGVRFPQRVVQLLNSLAPERSNNCALDIGCAVGGASFELARTFDHVDAFDFSESFVHAARRMQAAEEMSFCIPIEAELYKEVKASHDNGITPEIRSRINFFTGDACRISEMSASGTLGTYDGVVMANLICRLPDPLLCLEALPRVVNKGGVVVMVTPFSWLEQFTPRSKWLGGFYDPVTKEPIRSKDVLRSILESRGFEKIHEEEMPLVIREHQRKYQYIISEATGWRRTE